MKRLLVLDNYDSFTYNLVHLVRHLGYPDVEVARNDAISIEEARQYESILLSPGPGIPSEAGIMPELVRTLAPTKKILGICLGHQCIGEVFGGKLRNLSAVVHGKSTLINVLDPDDALFAGLPSNFSAGRYHSWVVDALDFPPCLTVTASDAAGEIMALRHETLNVRGLQFHPESILTDCGKDLMKNWLEKL